MKVPLRNPDVARKRPLDYKNKKTQKEEAEIRRLEARDRIALAILQYEKQLTQK